MLLHLQRVLLCVHLTQSVALGYKLYGPSGRRIADNNDKMIVDELVIQLSQAMLASVRRERCKYGGERYVINH